MRRYTTPTLPLTVPGIDLSSGFDVYVTFKQCSSLLTKSGGDLTLTYDSETDVTTVTASFTQAETAGFIIGSDMGVQVNWISEDGVRGATNIKKIRVTENLLEEVISYGD